MSDNKIKIGITVPVHNRREITLQCLRSLSKINRENLGIHVVVVDDGSSDGTSEAIKQEFPEVEIIQGDGNLWFTEGTNVGVRAVLKHKPDYVLTMNDDQVFDADFLRYLVETAEKHPRSIVGSLLLLWDQPHKLFQVSPEWKTFSGGWQHWVHQTVWTIPDKPWKVDIIVGNCLLVPRQAIEECGLMNSKKYPNFGDAEYTPRLKRNGWTLLIDPRSRVFCQPNNIPTKVSRLSLREKFRILFVDLGHIHNLRRRFYAYMDSAPTKIQGTIAFGIFFLRSFLKINVENQSFKEKLAEQPLKEKFAAVVVDE